MKQSNNIESAKLVRRLFIITAAVCLLCTFVFDKSKGVNHFTVAVAGFCMIAETAIFLAANKKLTYQNMFILLFVAGFFIRLDYVLYTPMSSTYFIRQHDMHGFGSGSGHAGYIEHFYNEGFKLPDFNPIYVSQFYHPPVHHFIAAMWMRLLTTIGMSFDRAVCSIQYLTLFYSSCCMLISERILNALDIDGKGKVAAFSIVAFHPSFIMLAGSINNDMLSTMFVLLAIYTTIKWYKESNIKNILPIALSIGLGMTTKLSAALVAFPVAFAFLVKFIKIIKSKGGWLNYFKQYCAFGILCIPLGMWFALRNFIVYNVPLNYVPRLSVDSDQYVGNWSTFDRLFDFWDFSFQQVYICWPTADFKFSEYNPTVSMLKSSMFGEYNYAAYNAKMLFPSKMLLWINILMVIISVAAMFYCCIKKIVKHEDNIILTVFLVFYQVMTYVNFIIFSLQYPHTCSMDYRYIVHTCVIGAVFIGIFINYFDLKMSENSCELYDENSKVCLNDKISDVEKNAKWLFKNIVKYCIVTVTVLFSVCSLTVYFMLGQ